MTLHLLHLKNYPILDQLRLEEALLRLDKRNWCLVNQGSPRAIVLGISGKAPELVALEEAHRDNIPLIKRFSGGGTVIVDESTLFVTFICEKELHTFPLFPEPIHKWAESLYKNVFNHPQFAWRENDYVLGDKKCGGNAQYIKKDRWLHHTSFLWGYNPENMSYLLHPKKTPAYRAGRKHTDFLCTLKEAFSHPDHFTQALKQELMRCYLIKEISLEEVAPLLNQDHRRATLTITPS